MGKNVDKAPEYVEVWQSAFDRRGECGNEGKCGGEQRDFSSVRIA